VSVRSRIAVAALLCVGYLMVGYVAPRVADAAPVPTWSNPCSADLDPGVCERVTYIASELSTIDSQTADAREMLGWLLGLTAFLVVVPLIARTFRA
jgi:hypothetical protein